MMTMLEALAFARQCAPAMGLSDASEEVRSLAVCCSAILLKLHDEKMAKEDADFDERVAESLDRLTKQGVISIKTR